MRHFQRIRRHLLTLKWRFSWDGIHVSISDVADNAAERGISFVIRVLRLRWLIRLLVADRPHWFAIYCLIVGSLTIAWQSGLWMQ